MYCQTSVCCIVYIVMIYGLFCPWIAHPCIEERPLSIHSHWNIVLNELFFSFFFGGGDVISLFHVSDIEILFERMIMAFNELPICPFNHR